MKIVYREQLHDLVLAAAAAPRRRSNLNLHAALDDPIQRFFNAMEPGTYVRPHRHTEAGKWELFVAISGDLALLTFDDRGGVIEPFGLA